MWEGIGVCEEHRHFPATEWLFWEGMLLISGPQMHTCLLYHTLPPLCFLKMRRRENKATGKNSWCSLSSHLIPLKFSDGMKEGEEPGLNEHVDSKAYLNSSSMQVSVQFKIKESSHVTHFIQGIGFPPKLILY